MEKGWVEKGGRKKNPQSSQNLLQGSINGQVFFTCTSFKISVTTEKQTIIPGAKGKEEMQSPTESIPQA